MTGNNRGNTELKEQHYRYNNTKLQLYYRAIAIKAVWYWHKNKYEDQWNLV
jgi:hypothetical protein